jgi:hypothetical protein
MREISRIRTAAMGCSAVPSCWETSSGAVTARVVAPGRSFVVAAGVAAAMRFSSAF